MKLRHWVNLFIIVGSSVLITYFALHLAITSYVEPTCKSYAKVHGLTYIGYGPLDPTVNSSHTPYEGDCKMLTANGETQIVSLVKAGGTSFGAPILISLALSWHLVFIASFFSTALILAMLIRLFTGKPAS
jgi:hypothetical protein